MKRLLIPLLLLIAAPVFGANITLTWDAAAGAASYKVYLSQATSAFTNILSPTAISAVIPVATNVTSRFYVTSVNAGGESIPSNAVTNSPAAPPVPIGSITLSAPVLSSTNLVPGQTVTGTALFKNGTSTPFSLGAGLLSARRPGTSNDTGPYDNWTPDVGVQMVAAGATLAVPGSWVVPIDGPAGQWRVYLSIRNAVTGAYIDGPDTLISVTATPIPLPPLPPTNLRGVLTP